MNRNLLEVYIANSGLKKSYIAHHLGVQPNTFSNKLAGRSDFTREEIGKLSELLNLTAGELENIFFSTQVEK